MIANDCSIEFDIYEDARQRLSDFLHSEVHDKLESERIAFYIIQGVRGVPKLITLLNQTDKHSSGQIRAALNGVFENLNSLNKAHWILNNNLDEKA